MPEADVYDCHDYTQDPDEFKAHYASLAEGRPFYNGTEDTGWAAPLRAFGPWSIPYRGQPFLVSEFGGIWWNPDAKPGEDSWGYGERPKDMEESYDRFEKLCAILLDDPNMLGYCYTQLTGIY